MNKKTTVKSLYSRFRVDPLKEKLGVEKDYGFCVMKLKRAGASNEEFHAAHAKAFQPYQQVMALGEMPEAKARELLYGLYAQHIIAQGSWRFRDPEDGSLHDGLGYDDSGKIVEATPQNIVALWQDNLHDLFTQIRSDATDMENFLQEQRSEAAKT